VPRICGIIDAAQAGVPGAERELSGLVARMAAAMRDGMADEVLLVTSAALGAGIARVSQTGSGRHALRSRETAVLTTGAPSCDGAASATTILPTVGAGAAADALFGLLAAGHPERLAEVDGPFAAVVLDPAAGTVMLATDRYGVERIFLHAEGPRVYFASEAKAILAVAPRTRFFDPDGLAQWLGCGGTLGESSLFRDVTVLAAGSLLAWNGSAAPRTIRYFSPERLEQLEPAGSDAFVAGISSALERAVERAVMRAPAAGVSLTGGLDSRMIVASLPAGVRVPCYTFGSMYRDSTDVSVARAVAATMGLPFEVIALDQRFVSDAPLWLDRAVQASDGFIGLSGAAELFVNGSARAIAPARITGNWGGELMRGVRAFKFHEPAGAFVLPDMQLHLAEAARTFEAASRRHANPLSYSLFAQMPFQGYGRYAVERSQVEMRAPFLANEVVEWLYRAPASVRGSLACATAIIGRRPELLAIPTDIGLLGTGSRPLRALRRAHRKSVVKAEYLVSHGAPDWLASLTASGPGARLERLVLGRNKFQHFRRWMRVELAGFVRETLVHDRRSTLHAWFDPRRIAGMVEEHISGRANYTDELDKLLTIASVERQLLAAAPGSPDAIRSDTPRYTTIS
jgi:asparagine synthase (glutamine-hydrolysing)